MSGKEDSTDGSEKTFHHSIYRLLQSSTLYTVSLRPFKPPSSAGDRNAPSSGSAYQLTFQSSVVSFFTVLSGSGELIYDGKKYDLKKGNMVFIDCRKPYSHTTDSNVTADEGRIEIEGECFLYDQATPAYTLIIGGSEASTTVENKKFRASVDVDFLIINSRPFRGGGR